MCISSRLGSSRASVALDELDRVPVEVGYPVGTEAAGKEVMRSRQQGDAVGGQACAIAIDIVGPEDDLDRPPAEIWNEAVFGHRGVDRGDPDLEMVEAQLDVNRHALLGRSKRLAETKTLVEADKTNDVVRVDIDLGV